MGDDRAWWVANIEQDFVTNADGLQYIFYYYSIAQYAVQMNATMYLVWLHTLSRHPVDSNIELTCISILKEECNATHDSVGILGKEMYTMRGKGCSVVFFMPRRKTR
jgi:hypothetical protein